MAGDVVSRRFLAELVLPGIACSVSLARRWVGDVLRVAGHLDVERARLVMSELVANAVLHTDSGRPGGLVTVEINSIGQERVHIQVIDEGAVTVPRPRTSGECAVSGRGLRLVEESSVRWGMRRELSGYAVWAEVITAASAEAEQERAGSTASGVGA